MPNLQRGAPLLLVGILFGPSACLWQGIDPAPPVSPAALPADATVLFGRIDSGFLRGSFVSRFGLTEPTQEGFARESELEDPVLHDLSGYFYRGVLLRRMDANRWPVGDPIRISADPSGHFVARLEPGEYWIWRVEIYEKDPNKLLQLGSSDDSRWTFDGRSRGIEVRAGAWNNLGALTLIEDRDQSGSEYAWIRVLGRHQEVIEEIGLDAERRGNVVEVPSFEVARLR